MLFLTTPRSPTKACGHIQELTSLSELDLSADSGHRCRAQAFVGTQKSYSAATPPRSELGSPTPGWCISRGWPASRKLHLSATQVTDVGLAHRARLTKLATLDLSATQVTDLGFAPRRGPDRAHSLRALGHAGYRSGTGAPERADQASNFHLDYTRVTDLGLVRLKGLTKLSDLGLRDTSVTSTGLNGFKQTFPRMVITD